MSHRSPSPGRRRALALALAAAAALAACSAFDGRAGAGRKEGPGAAPQAAEYRLGAGDRLQVTVFGQPDLSGTFEIGGEGTVALPLLGAVPAGGRTLRELSEDIRVRLDKDYVVNPRVNIEVTNYRPFYILGQVTRPGSYPYVAGLDVRQAIAIAGGYTRRANTSRVIVTRETGGERSEITLSPDDPILPGDTLDVPRRLF